MHFYQWNIKDYISHTLHLEPLEDLAYRRLLDHYFLHETPLLNDVAKLARLIRMKENIAEIESVLCEFFYLKDDNYWHHKRADKELGKYSEASALTEAKRNSDKERQQRYRDKRKKLCAELREREISFDFNVPNSELEALLSRHDNEHVTRDVTKENKKPTATQDPIPNTHEPIPNSKVDVNADNVFAVFTHWRDVMGKPLGKTKLSTKRDKAIRARLKDGYSVDDIKKAIDHCSNTSHNMGLNDRGTKYNDIELICRNSENLERFMENKGDMHARKQSGLDFKQGQQDYSANGGFDTGEDDGDTNQ